MESAKTQRTEVVNGLSKKRRRRTEPITESDTKCARALQFPRRPTIKTPRCPKSGQMISRVVRKRGCVAQARPKNKNKVGTPKTTKTEGGRRVPHSFTADWQCPWASPQFSCCSTAQCPSAGGNRPWLQSWVRIPYDQTDHRDRYYKTQRKKHHIIKPINQSIDDKLMNNANQSINQSIDRHPYTRF